MSQIIFINKDYNEITRNHQTQKTNKIQKN
jgi:hypothetical protein